MLLLEEARALSGDLTRLRETLHRHPELGLRLPRTQDTVLASLDGLPLEITCGRALTSVTAVLRGTHPGRPDKQAPVVLLRADLDGLPVHETSGVAYTSRVDGVMHACGHDLHAAMLVGAARLLSAHRDQLAGDVVFMFQPGEEGFDGARYMIEEGVLDAAGRPADAAFALHVFAAMLPHGVFAHRPGQFLSASAELSVTVHGEGGHGSTPYRAKDPVTAAAEMICGLQTMVTRQFDVFDPVVISVGVVRAGTNASVIPHQAHFAATVRAFSEAAQGRLRAALPRLLEGIALAHGLAVELDYQEQYPVTVNDAGLTAFAADAITELFGEDRSHRMAAPLGGSEDFSRVLAQVPGSFIGLSAVPAGADFRATAFNHSPRAEFDSSVLPDGASLLAELAARRLTPPDPRPDRSNR